MRTFAIIIVFAVVSGLHGGPLRSRLAAADGSAVPPAAQKVLDAIRAADKGQLAVSEEDGRFLRTLIASTGATRVLEIGAASGYSGIWMGLGLRETGGRLTTIEYDPQRAREAKANIKAAAAVIAPLQGLEPEVVERSLQRYEFGVKPLTPAVAAEQQKIADTFHALGLIPKPIRVADALPGSATVAEAAR